jgi:hypothetical protein
MKHKFLFALKFTGLFVFYLVITMVAEAVYPSTVEVEPSPGAVGALFTQLLINCLAIAYLTNRLELSGWKRIAATTMVVYGIQLFMTQMETWIFREAFPTMGQSELVKLVTMGLVVIFTASAFAALLWKKKETTVYRAENEPALKGWGYKIPILSVAYMLLYFFFGTYVAFQSEALRDFYESSLGNINSNGLMVTQIFRGGLWVLLCLPFVLWLKGNLTEKVISTALFLALLPTILLFFPNPFMPYEIRMYHFVEVFLSNGIFGALTAWWLTSKRVFVRNKSLNLNPSGIA